MHIQIRKRRGPATLRAYISIAITGTVAAVLIFCSIFFYKKTANLLTVNHQEQVMNQLGRVNEKVGEQISLIDSLNTQFMSNTLIRDQVEPITYSSDKRLAVERQMGYLLINHYLWHEGMIQSACIFLEPTHYYYVSVSEDARNLSRLRQAARSMPVDDPGFSIRTADNAPDYIYFVRNIYSTYTGQHIATTVFEINKNAWSGYFNSNMDPQWSVCITGGGMSLSTSPATEPYVDELFSQASPVGTDRALKTLTAGGQEYLSASMQVVSTDLTSMVIAPKNQMLDELNRTLRVYWVVLLACCGAAILISFAIGSAITTPVHHMITHMNKIAKGNHEIPMPPMPMYTEFNELAGAFNHMLEQLNTYYKDNMEKQLLLKNSEIQSLQAQMDPHFLFNTLNTIAWNAQMEGNEETYQMVISLGELLKTNVVAKQSNYTTLGEELQYVRLYTYLQKMRFEDKISVDIQVSPELYGTVIPRFCIQPLVENAFVHGLEPKKGAGKLAVNVICQENQLEINVLDNGIGFQEIPDIEQIVPDSRGSHTHIGLRNLNRRLRLLYGGESCLHISSTPYVCTMISFHVPLHTAPKEDSAL